MGELFPHSDETAMVEIAPTWPTGNIAGYAHDGETYCIQCAEEHSKIDTERYFKNPRSVLAGGAIMTNDEYDRQIHCAEFSCGRKLDVVVLHD